MSIKAYFVRNKKNPSLYYRSKCNGRPNSGGWVDDVRKARCYLNLNGPSKVISMYGKENCELLTVDFKFQTGTQRKLYCVRNKKTGKYFAMKSIRSKKILYTDEWSKVGLWTSLKDASRTARLYTTIKIDELRQNMDELEVVEMITYVPDMEIQ